MQAAFAAVSLDRKPRARSKEMDAVGPPADAAMERSGQWGSARAAARSPTLEGMPSPPWEAGRLSSSFRVGLVIQHGSGIIDRLKLESTSSIGVKTSGGAMMPHADKLVSSFGRIRASGAETRDKCRRIRCSWILR